MTLDPPSPQERVFRGFPGKSALPLHSFLSACLRDGRRMLSELFAERDFQIGGLSEHRRAGRLLHPTLHEKALASRGPYFPHPNNGAVNSCPT